MRIGLSILTIVVTITALSQGKPAFAGALPSVTPNEPTNEQKAAQQPRDKAPTATAPIRQPSVRPEKPH